MNRQQIDTYLAELRNGSRSVEGLEVSALERYKRGLAELEDSRNALARLTAQLKQLEGEVKRREGIADAYATILIVAEEQRHDIKPISLEELRKKMNADKIEAFDGDGKLVDKAEAPEAQPSMKKPQE